LGLSKKEKKELALAVYETNKARYPKRLIAKAFSLARSTLYYEGTLQYKDANIKNQILKEYEIDDTLGCRKLASLFKTTKNRVFRVMLKYGITPRRKRPAYKYPGKADSIVENKLMKEEYEKYEVLFSDIFQLRLSDKSWVYGCFVMRKQTRQILSFCYSYGMQAWLVSESITRIDLGEDMSEKDVVFHSDQGKQYGAKVTLDACVEQHFERSMSRAGRPTDNGFAERFVGTFKLAVVERYSYENIGQFVEFATKWLNFYNNRRPHESLVQESPNDYARENGYQIVPYLSLNFV